MTIPPPPWDTYRAIMECRLAALDKRPGVRPMGIGETLCRALDKLVTRAAGDQVKMVCGNLQRCESLEAGIEGATHAVVQRRLERARQIRSKEEARRHGKEEYEDEEAGVERLKVETEGIEEEAVEILVASLTMEVKEEGEGEEGSDGTLMAL